MGIESCHVCSHCLSAQYKYSDPTCWEIVLRAGSVLLDSTRPDSPDRSERSQLSLSERGSVTILVEGRLLIVGVLIVYVFDGG